MCEKKIDVPALFGKMVFGEQQMQQRLPAEAYRAWQQSRTQGTGGGPALHRGFLHWERPAHQGS